MLKILSPLTDILKSSCKSEGNPGIIFTDKFRDKIWERVISS
jgi:hypothetical protein